MALANDTSIFEEAASALKGVARLIVGDRRAPEHFDPSTRGLAGSFIAFTMMVAATSLVVAVLPGGGTSFFRSVMADLLLYGGQIALAALYLRQIRKSDGFIPYLVAINWSTSYLTLAGLLVGFLLGGVFFMLIASVAILITMINIARFVLGLPGLQVALFIGAQILGGVLGALVFMMMFPIPAEQLQQLSGGP